MRDNIHNPAHYAGNNGIECIDCIRAAMPEEAYAGFLQGNVLKYVFRYRRKGGIEDLEKAEVYLHWLKKAEEDTEDCRRGKDRGHFVQNITVDGRYQLRRRENEDGEFEWVIWDAHKDTAFDAGDVMALPIIIKAFLAAKRKEGYRDEDFDPEYTYLEKEYTYSEEPDEEECEEEEPDEEEWDEEDADEEEWDEEDAADNGTAHDDIELRISRLLDELDEVTKELYPLCEKTKRKGENRT